MNARPVVTRIAPSPTGDPHIGTGYMALFNYLFARSQGGRFILRIEDTDRQRSHSASEQSIFAALKWLGIPWDEGPDIGGPSGPYRQSERSGIYRDHVQHLVDTGKAYHCFCSAERLQQLRKDQMSRGEDPRYDGHCAGLSQKEVSEKLAAGTPHTIRLRVPASGECVAQERLRGEIRIAWETVDHQILLKSDGFPTYHLANVVDDHLMGVSHVIRGEEWISSLPKHLLLYDAFEWERPEFIHLPLLRNPDKSKLSKRKNPTSVFYYRDAGILPEALLNYLGMMGYTLPDGRELFSLDEIRETFNIDRVSLGGPVFDLTKLKWLNGRYLREKLDSTQVLERLQQWKLNSEQWLPLVEMTQKRLETLSDFMPMVAHMFADRLTYDPELLISQKVDMDTALRLLHFARLQCSEIRTWTVADVRQLMENLAAMTELKLRDVTGLFFVVMSGRPVSIPLFDSAAQIGLDLFRRRIQYALEMLAEKGNQLKGKALKKLEKDYKQAVRLLTDSANEREKS